MASEWLGHACNCVIETSCDLESRDLDPFLGVLSQRVGRDRELDIFAGRPFHGLRQDDKLLHFADALGQEAAPQLTLEHVVDVDKDAVVGLVEGSILLLRFQRESKGYFGGPWG